MTQKKLTWPNLADQWLSRNIDEYIISNTFIKRAVGPVGLRARNAWVSDHDIALTVRVQVIDQRAHVRHGVTLRIAGEIEIPANCYNFTLKDAVKARTRSCNQCHST